MWKRLSRAFLLAGALSLCSLSCFSQETTSSNDAWAAVETDLDKVEALDPALAADLADHLATYLALAEDGLLQRDKLILTWSLAYDEHVKASKIERGVSVAVVTALIAYELAMARKRALESR
jgi:hypothetical protein